LYVAYHVTCFTTFNCVSAMKDKHVAVSLEEC